MKSPEEVDKIMETIPAGWRYVWCGGEFGPCACRGCVQTGNRIVMYFKITGKQICFDPEYIDESKIPVDVFHALKITRDEWEAWKLRHQDIVIDITPT